MQPTAKVAPKGMLQLSPHLLPAPSSPLLQPRQLKIGEEHGQLNDGWVKPFNVSDYHYPEADEGDSGPKLILLEWHVSNASGFLLPHQPAGWQGTGWAHDLALPTSLPTPEPAKISSRFCRLSIPASFLTHAVQEFPNQLENEKKRKTLWTNCLR